MTPQRQEREAALVRLRSALCAVVLSPEDEALLEQISQCAPWAAQHIAHLMDRLAVAHGAAEAPGVRSAYAATVKGARP